MYIGVDVSKAALDVAARPTGEADRFENTPAGIRRLVSWIAGRCASLVVLESTGGLERAAADALADAQVPVAVLNPRTGQGLREGYRSACKNGYPRCGDPGSFRRSGSAAATAKRRSNVATTRRSSGSPSTGD